MCSVKPAAEAHLNNCRCDLFLAECFKDGADKDFKLCGWPYTLFNLVGGIKGSRDRLGEGERRERLPIDLHAFPVADQVWLRRGGVADPRCAEGRGDEGDDAPLPIGPCDECAANPRLGGAESTKEGVRSPQPHANAEASARLKRHQGGAPRIRATPLTNGKNDLGTSARNAIAHLEDQLRVTRLVRHRWSVAVSACCVRESPYGTLPSIEFEATAARPSRPIRGVHAPLSRRLSLSTY
jgi:hypothetical protein